MTALTTIHIGSGALALMLGTLAICATKGGRLHVRAGSGFCVAMLVLGVSASILAPFKTPPDTPIGGLMVCYFVISAWQSARRQSGRPERSDQFMALLGLSLGLAIGAGGLQLMFATQRSNEPPGPYALLMLGGLCLFAAIGDLRWIWRGWLSARARIARHLWRMCFAFFIATGSFFLGQQDVLPASLRGSMLWVVLAFAPFLVMVYWLARSAFTRTDARA